jgi:Xaa-Pro aminopeptidase
MPLNSAEAVYQRNAPRQHGAMEYSEAPVDLDLVRLYRLGRIREQLKARDYAGILLFDQVNTRYATDATNMQIWCSHYETRCAFIATEGPVVLFAYADHPHLVEDLPTIDEYRVMPTFYYFSAGSRVAEYAKKFGDQIGDLVSKYGGGNRRQAVDRLSHIGCDAIRAQGVELHDGQAVTEHARSVKSVEELELMKRAIAVCEEGMAAMYAVLEPGITENALWAKLHETNIRLGGEWIETRLLSSGPRTNPWFRECSLRPIERGDLVSFDTDLIGPYGYCSDISRAWICGDKPSDEQRRLYAAAYEQIKTNISIIKAGKTLGEIAESAWPIPEDYLSNRYSCAMHGVGLADEYPSIKHAIDHRKDGYDDVLLPGMTLCVESFIGVEGGKEGVKLEEQVLITEGGVEQLSSYPLQEDWL